MGENWLPSAFGFALTLTGIGLLVIYMGLFYLGATGNQYFPADISRSALV